MLETVLLVILVAIAIGEIPSFHLNRATIALVGVVVLLVFRFVDLEDAFLAVDLNTICLLFAMMLFTAHLRLAGFFDWAGQTLGRLSSRPRLFLFWILVFSSVLSAILINDTVVLMMTPLVAQVALAARLNPIPFLIALAVGSNIGSMTTPIGNPQNILIATSSGLGFAEFLSRLALPALLSLAMAYLLIFATFRSAFSPQVFVWTVRKTKLYRPLLVKCAVSMALIVAGFALGWGLTVSALAGAGFLLLTRRIKPDKVVRNIDWNLLIFFSALFVVTKTIESTGVFQSLLKWGLPLMRDHVEILAGLSAALSNLISNVPAVMVLKPAVVVFPNADQAWIVLAASSTLAGNLTLLGSVANLIVAESAKSFGIRLGFFDYLKVGLPLTLVSLVATIALLL